LAVTAIAVGERGGRGSQDGVSSSRGDHGNGEQEEDRKGEVPRGLVIRQKVPHFHRDGGVLL
jgi:hypothetical protein